MEMVPHVEFDMCPTCRFEHVGSHVNVHVFFAASACSLPKTGCTSLLENRLQPLKVENVEAAGPCAGSFVFGQGLFQAKPFFRQVCFQAGSFSGRAFCRQGLWQAVPFSGKTCFRQGIFQAGPFQAVPFFRQCLFQTKPFPGRIVSDRAFFRQGFFQAETFSDRTFCRQERPCLKTLQP